MDKRHNTTITRISSGVNNHNFIFQGTTFSLSMEKPHVVVVPYPAQGHFSPLIFLSRKLAEIGCKVTIFNVKAVHEQAKQWSFPEELDIKLKPLHPKLHMPNGVLNAWDRDTIGFYRAIEGLEPEFMDAMEEFERSEPVHCVISDHFIGGWPFTVCTKLGVQHATYWPGNATWLLVECHIPLMISRGDVPLPKDGEVKRVVSYLPGVGPLNSNDLPTYLAYPEVNAKNAPRLTKTNWILCNSFPEFELAATEAMKQVLTGVNFHQIGPLFSLGKDDQLASTSLMSEDRTCIDWLDEQAPSSVLYVSFGSLAKLALDEFKELAEGLKASEVTVLWSIRQNSFAKPDREAFPEFARRVESSSSKMKLLTWAPQREILSHAAVCGFLTHCGWNSIIESIARGVPMLALPCIFDQVLNSKLVEDLGIAFALPRSPTCSAVQRAVSMLISNKGNIKGRAMELQQACKHASSTSSVDNLADFIRGIQQK